MREQGGIRQALLVRPENDDIRGRGPQARFQPVAQPPHRGRLGRHIRASGIGSRAKARNRRNILGTGPQAAFLTAAADQRLGQMQSLAPNQRTGALRAADLVRGNRQKIGLQFIDIAFDPSRRLDRIDVQQIEPASWTMSATSRIG